jgi:hypothetical protein
MRHIEIITRKMERLREGDKWYDYVGSIVGTILLICILKILLFG